MQVYDIKTDADGRELTQHGELDFPCAFYDEKFSEFVGQEVPWHWHEEIEIVMVVEGSANVESLGTQCELHPGEALIINASALHRMTDIGTNDCRVLNVVLDPLFLAGSKHSKIYKRYFLPARNNTQFSVYKLTPNVAWQACAIDALSLAFEDLQSQNFGFEISVQSQLARFWFLFCRHEPNIFIHEQLTQKTESRIQNLINFIHQHYAKQISVADISSAAQISSSECFRLFKNCFQCSPNNYLLNFRLQQAAKNLLETQSSITQVSLAVGFNSPAYFSKKFKLQFGVRPREFRKL
ncbi:AraC family transcriptional regulator [Alginatibacterium sediminis]|uniref:AraC family transcriptional regulator n=1 Tax=Alginatibacterium sediminis TaxID=2164068 RepID=A0A420E6P1_9ALTE|nr:AraC family transcriptional regulator [Alginatibacterium sediminis]RKF14287.1 AraC family transcriptional regulator [Alginatibacterium sediminis]